MMKKLALVLVAVLGLAAPVEAQLRSPCDAVIPQCWHFDTTEVQRRETGTVAFAGVTSLVVLSNVVWQWDQDHGGYPDKFYPQKALAHAGAAAGLVQVALALHVRPWFAVLWTNVAGAGFEVSQGYVNPHDLAANAVGSVIGLALAKCMQPVRF